MVNTVRGVEVQTQLFRKMADDLNYTIQRDVSEFVVAQNRQLVQTQDLADQLRRRKQFLTIQEDLIERQRTLVKGLNLEIDQPDPPSATQPLPLGLKQRIAAAKAAVQANLDVQSKMEESLFDARKQLRDLGDSNRKLEQQIRELEEKTRSR
jgi:chromosome segregation ATPase